MPAGGRTARAAVSAVFAGFALAALPVAAHSRPATGATSSATANISVSVAARFGVAAPAAPELAGAPLGGPAPPCLATNAQVPAIPVFLVRASSGASGGPDVGPGRDRRPVDDAALPILPCGEGGERGQAGGRHPADGQGGELWLVRPE